MYESQKSYNIYAAASVAAHVSVRVCVFDYDAARYCIERNGHMLRLPSDRGGRQRQDEARRTDKLTETV